MSAFRGKADMQALVEATRNGFCWENLSFSFNLMALVIYDGACLEPSYLRFIASGGLAHAFAPRSLEITVLCRLTCLPQIDTAADALFIVEKLLADQAGNILKASRN